MSKIILYGDGIHDDSDAVQAWSEGKSVYTPHGKKIPKRLLEGKSLYFSKSITVSPSIKLTISHCDFLTTPLLNVVTMENALAGDYDAYLELKELNLIVLADTVTAINQVYNHE